MLIAAEIDMTVLLHGDLGVTLHLVRSLRQREEFRLFHCVEVLFSGVGTLLHACLIVVDQELKHCGIQFLQREELAVSQACIYPMVDDLHLILYLGLLLTICGTGELGRYRCWASTKLESQAADATRG